MVRTRRRAHQSPHQTTAQISTQTDTTINTNENVILNNDSDSDTEVNLNDTFKSKPKIQIFKGIGDKVTIENWLKRFEMLSQFRNWPNKTKVVMLGNFLEDDALNWYIENSIDNNFADIKEKLINRFGLESVEPIIECINHRYDVKTGIKDYFETKRRYGIAAKLTEAQIIPIMINNLPLKMSECFTAVKPKTFAEFYSIAKTAENNFKRNAFKTQFNEKTKPKSENTHEKPKRKPPNPCRICDGLGFKNRYHWSSDCRNKAKTHSQTNQTNPKTINSIENCDFGEIPENDIRNINLN